MMEDTKPETLKKRYNEFNAVALTASYLYRKNFLGETLDVLVETRRDRNSGLLTGYSDNYIKVLFEGDDSLMKRVVPINIEKANLAYTSGSYGK